MKSYLNLSKSDQQLLTSYSLTLKALSNFLGHNHEIILYSLENIEKSALVVINGHLSNTKKNDPISDLALKKLKDLEKNSDSMVMPFFEKNEIGSILKSSTIPIFGENNRVIGLICINLPLEIPLIDFLSDLMPPIQQKDKETNIDIKNSETFSESIDELITISLNKMKQSVHNNPEISSLNENKEIVVGLYDQGIFNLKDAVLIIAKKLGISKNTVYLHIRNHKSDNF
ncbi:helix-turn-helix transcriptional regulator [Vagococcus hydrophili]|uniref:YheO-like protein n=1 Tax=Vagococcus hydrophili TaxID=2714947 RepID=A0A6G8AXI8_9ENTE|nr:PAS domain-containing protein [Vagococcus hydrophili]QIL49672.1 hypothetical protein G7082_14760 [Vagococcus hydrophili]